VSEKADAFQAPQSGRLLDKLLRASLREAGVAIALIGIIVFFTIFAPYFATSDNFLKIFVQIAINTVLASGMTFVILTGGIDLSVGSLLALCTVVGASIMIDPRFSPTEAIVLASLGAMGTGAALGAVNGWVCEKWKLPSFIVTLGHYRRRQARRSARAHRVGPI
jgi:ribose transport system permease protein